ncbi:MAG: DUF1127 domain-containing protein [Paracoccus sp. (in: a-proteobacteria)]|nr:DUF1127 domain-containing protein [Paracoccus sp. (in: a-proteobacteria)]
MAMTSYNTPAATGFFARMAQALHKWRRVRETRRELDRLSDRELDDIGISRADIHGLAHMM